MKIEDLKKELERIDSAYIKCNEMERGRSRIMLDAILCVVMPTEDNDARVMKLLRLIMSCSESKKNKHKLARYATSVISADYLLSVREGKKAMRFLNRALKLYGEWMGESTILEIEDADAFIDEFRATYLKGQKERKNQAINNIYILHEAGRRLNIQLCMEDLLEDAPISWHLKTSFQLLIMTLVSGFLLSIPLAESMAPWRAANNLGNPISIFDAWKSMDEPMLYAGIVMLFLTIWHMLWVGSKSYISMMGRVAYWKYNR